MIKKPAKALLGALLVVALTSTALAKDNKLVVPEMPKVVPELGDPDAVCVLGSVDSYSRIKTGLAKDKKSDDRQLLDLALRELAFYAGKLSARFTIAQSQLKMSAVAGRYYDPAVQKEQTPTVIWCFRSYVKATGADFSKRMDAAYRWAKAKKLDDTPLLKPASVERNAMCLSVVSHALPATVEAAKTNPKAAVGAQDLYRAQHFYIGRLLAQPDQAKVDADLGQAFLMSAQMRANNDEPAARENGLSCIEEFKDVSTSLLESAKSDWKPAE